MSSLRSSLAVTVLVAALASCSPYQAPPIPPGPFDPGLNPSITAGNRAEEAKKKASKEVAKTQKQARKKAESVKKTADEALSDASDSLPKPTVKPKPIAKPKPKVPTFPVAKKVPGREGFVYSPYDNKIIDVRTVPAGKLVKNPKDPASSKRYFRVPK